MARNRPGKRERAAIRAARDAESKAVGLTVMDTRVNYGPSCAQGLELFRPGAKKWGYDPRGMAKHERERRRIGAAIRRANRDA